MTEARLFAIGLALWFYKVILQDFLRRKSKPTRSLTALLHASFWCLIGVLLAVTMHAYLGNVRGFLRVGAIGAAVGAIFGLFSGLIKADSAKAAKDTLTLDLEWAQTASSAILLAAVIMYTLLQAFKIPSGSMQPTLYEGDHLFVSKFYYGIRIPFTQKRILALRQVRQKDVVVFQFPTDDPQNQQYGKDFIKRALALPNDTVLVRNKEIFVNGVSIGKEPYTQFLDTRVFAKTPGNSSDLEPGQYQDLWARGELSNYLRSDEIRDNFGPVRVPPGHCFVMGDNRDASYDSRFWGPMPMRYLKGKAWFIYWPPRRVKAIR
ncbi:MAG: signal peptidase I [Elusimicrobiota bacterium]